MSKDHADYLSDAEIQAEIRQIAKDIAEGKKSDDELERDAFFTAPEHAEETALMLERMRLVEELYRLRKEAGLTQKELAEKLGTCQSYITALERGRKNATFETLFKYARACGKTLKISML